jgi:hypothetical protein
MMRFAAHDSPHLSDRTANVCEQRLVLKHLSEALHQRTQPVFRHRRDQIVEHAALTEQRMDAALCCVGFEHPIIAQRLAVTMNFGPLVLTNFGPPPG